MTVTVTLPTQLADDRTLYRPPRKPVLVKVPAFDFLMIDGRGYPSESPEYVAAISALYSTTYPVVMTLKNAGRADLKVHALEGLWWADDYAAFDPRTLDPAAWRWTMMMRQPDDVPVELVESSIARAAKKVGADVAGRLRVERFDEGLCAQLMHFGPYSAEGPNIQLLHDFVASSGLQLRGRHHEIYLGDPRRCAPEKLRTIIRNPVSH